MFILEKNGWSILCSPSEFLDLWLSSRFKGEYNADLTLEENIDIAIKDFEAAGYSVT